MLFLSVITGNGLVADQEIERRDAAVVAAVVHATGNVRGRGIGKENVKGKEIETDTDVLEAEIVNSKSTTWIITWDNTSKFCIIFLFCFNIAVIRTKTRIKKGANATQVISQRSNLLKILSQDPDPEIVIKRKKRKKRLKSRKMTSPLILQT